jgi:arylsulfatase A-like enzyme
MTKHQLNRRDFLKLANLLPLSIVAPRLLRTFDIRPLDQTGLQNVLIIVFDAWSAYHVSTYGYERETMPNLTRLAKQAVVYHNHYAGGNFTTPGTASLLTGTLPWTHRAFQPNGTVIEPYATRNIFGAFQDHYRIAYTHNPWANKLLEQFSGELDELVPRLSLFLASYDQYIRRTFKKDEDIASVSWTRNVNVAEEGYAYSLFFSHINELIREKNIEGIKKSFPRGIPSIGTAENSFVLEDAINWVGDRLPEIPQPFLGYFHFLPPHGPYRTSQEFYNSFGHDGYQPVDKPEDIFTQKVSKADLLKKRNEYDEFLLYADREFGKLFEQLKTSGLLENTWVVVTSDHGEMFERGIDGHSVDALYQPVIRVPLMIFEPGRETGADIHIPTSAVDVLPTMLHVTGQEIPAWAEGSVLAPYADSGPDLNRSVYTVRSNKTEPSAPIKRGSLTVTKGHYKLHYYFGYEERDVIELVKLYNVDEDPEELVDLASSQQEITTELLKELKIKLDAVNQPYL